MPKRLVDRAARLVAGPDRLEEAAVEDGVRAAGRARQGVREARGEPHHLDQQLEQLGLGQEQGLDLDPGVQSNRSKKAAKRWKAVSGLPVRCAASQADTRAPGG